MTSITELKSRAWKTLGINGNYWPTVVGCAAESGAVSVASSAVSDVVGIVFFPLIYLVMIIWMLPTVYLETNYELSDVSTALSVLWLYAMMFLLIGLMTVIATAITNAFAGLPVYAGYWTFWKNRKYGTGQMSDVLTPFKHYKNVMKTGIKCYGKILLWSLLFFVPGIVQSYRYLFVPMIVSENPDISAEEAMERSDKMTEGKKGDLFLLHLSFIGWELLALMTCGIGFFFLNPYIKAAEWEAYEDAKAEYTGFSVA